MSSFNATHTVTAQLFSSREHYAEVEYIGIPLSIMLAR